MLQKCTNIISLFYERQIKDIKLHVCSNFIPTYSLIGDNCNKNFHLGSRGILVVNVQKFLYDRDTLGGSQWGTSEISHQ